MKNSNIIHSKVLRNVAKIFQQIYHLATLHSSFYALTTLLEHSLYASALNTGKIFWNAFVSIIVPAYYLKILSHNIKNHFNSWF
jgi:uncharacterized membrane protein YjjB (DUF3815 family)